MRICKLTIVKFAVNATFNTPGIVNRVVLLVMGACLVLGGPTSASAAGEGGNVARDDNDGPSTLDGWKPSRAKIVISYSSVRTLKTLQDEIKGNYSLRSELLEAEGKLHTVSIPCPVMPIC